MEPSAISGRQAAARDSEAEMTDLNAQAFFSARVARQLAAERLQPAEAVILIRYRDAYAGKSVLDLGVGSGRTTRYLLPFSRTYLGLDLSVEMLALAKDTFPAARFVKGDLRDIDRAIGEEEPPFDFVLIAYNTIDVLSHADRLALIDAIRARLVPGGLFVFSTHNRAWHGSGRPPSFPTRHGFGDLPHYVWAVITTLRERRNHIRLASRQRQEADHAIVTGSLRRSGLVYCIDEAAQRRQLREHGFEVLSVYDCNADPVESGKPAADSYNLHFVCRAAD
ncbi:methyltransferase domain-containing protein [Stappia sp. F7233]|uniref:Methyltransferase domain-containing protein n=1 Tax=Stappia albiluteola TaxID=2758565 RepID=A0A839AIZ9_9HYPH|nr:class I SAM-dependent methyltransferase [Stappia albiluteola]MBA5778489.1 methyltransferase domain-containing protein [Stappia albiluteola]